MNSKLYLVPTPIGNLDDITFRAVKVLASVDLIIAEDTRTSSKLLNHYNISTRTESFHMHNEHKKLSHYLEQLENGISIALISDAGTPGISDPGFLLVRSCVINNIDVECLPGATAFVPALVNSGLPSDRFVFEGFLPQKKGRKKRLEELKQEERTIIFYESPFRLLKTLSQLAEMFSLNHEVCVSRELTKIYEENIRGCLKDVIQHYNAKPPKGEIVIVFNPRLNKEHLESQNFGDQ
jgi:16S rRNA (cytidine1402-2'-O)-methyltransferase